MARSVGRETALVTGGSRGLGLAAARSLLEAGHEVAILARNPERLRTAQTRLQREFHRPVVGICGDLAAQGTARRAVSQTLRRFGRLDVIVAAAGDVPVGSLDSLSLKDWQAAFGSKVFGHISLFREAFPHLCKHGTGLLLALTGATGKEPSASNLAAGATNAALQNVMRALADQFGPMGVRVLTVSPGPFRTDRLRTIARRQGLRCSVDEVAQRFAKGIPLGRIGDPAELGALVRFLSSPQAAFLHGATIVIDGGKQRAV